MGPVLGPTGGSMIIVDCLCLCMAMYICAAYGLMCTCWNVGGMQEACARFGSDECPAAWLMY